jgi:hypothetical protein
MDSQHGDGVSFTTGDLLLNDPMSAGKIIKQSFFYRRQMSSASWRIVEMKD